MVTQGCVFLGPEGTRISYLALLATTTCAALREESRMQFRNATNLNRKSKGIAHQQERLRIDFR